MLFPHAASKRIALRPAGDQDAPRAYSILFRLGRGGLPLLDDFSRNFGRELSACFMIHAGETDDVVGFCTLSERALARHVRAEVNLLPGQAPGALADATLLLTNFAFAMWHLNKVYFHTVEPGLDGLGLGPEHVSLVREETVLPQYTYLHGGLRDVRVLAIDRTQWDMHGVGIVERVVG